MDLEFTLMKLELDLLATSGPDADALPEFMEATVAAAGTQEGYSGLAWKAGAKILDIANKHGQDLDRLFDGFGWSALARALQTAMQDSNLIQALSYASVPFLPPSGSLPIFDHPQIIEAIRAGLAKNRRPFIKPSELSLADPAAQIQFGELLSRLRNFSVDNEVLLQWSSGALRALPTQSPCHQIAATSLLQTLHSEKRSALAYYTFRALAEQHEGLWQQPLAFSILQAFVERHWQDKETGAEVLNHLCADDDLLRRADENFALLILVGALGINLTRRYAYTEAEAAAWRFINEMYGSYTLVAYALADYLTEGKLPALPTPRAHRLKALKEESDRAVELANKQLRSRRYAQLPLAARIYRSNVQDVFAPLLEKIQSESCSYALVEHIKRVDPEELVTESKWQKSSTNPVDGKLLRKMIRDSSRILEALESAAKRRAELNEARADSVDQSSDDYELYQEFGSLLDCLDEIAVWSLKTLLSDFWRTIQEGSAIASREQEVDRYGERYC